MDFLRKFVRDCFTFIGNHKTSLLLSASLIMRLSSPSSSSPYPVQNRNTESPKNGGGSDVDSDQKKGYKGWYNKIRPGLLETVQMATDVYAPLYRGKVRKILLPLSESSFQSVSIPLLKDMVEAIKLSRAVYTKIVDGHALSIGDDDQPDCVAQYDDTTKTLWIVTRGTHTSDDILSDTTWVQSTAKIGHLDIPVGVVKRCEKIIPMILEHLEVLAIRKNEVKRICFVGHSLGGAISIGLYLSWNLDNTAMDYNNYYSSIQTSVITVGAPLVLSNPPESFRTSSQGYCQSSQKSTNSGSESDETGRKSGSNLGKNVHNVVMALDIVPRILGSHPLPTCITSSSVGGQFEKFLSGKVHRETYRPFGHFYSLREREDDFDVDLQNLSNAFSFRNKDKKDEREGIVKNEYLLGLATEPEILLRKFPENIGDIAYATLRDHKIEDTEKSIILALKQRTSV